MILHSKELFTRKELASLPGIHPNPESGNLAAACTLDAVTKLAVALNKNGFVDRQAGNEYHLTNNFNKTGMSSRKQLARFMIRHQLVYRFVETGTCS